MKCQALGIVLCAFFSATYGSGDLVWYFNATTGIMSVSTEKCGKAALFDPRSVMSTLYNGKTGEAVVIDHKCKTELFIPPNTCEHTWLSSKQSFSDFFKTVVPPKELLESGKKVGVSYNSTNITTGMLEKISNILTPLSAEYSSPCYALDIYRNHSIETDEAVKKHLSCLGEIVGSLCSTFAGDLKQLSDGFEGMSNLFALVKGGLCALKGQKLDFKQVLKAKTGFDTLVIFLKSLVKVKGTEALWSALNCQEKFFYLIKGLAGDDNHGVDALVEVVYNILEYIQGKNSDHHIVVVVNDYFKKMKADNVNFESQWKSNINCLLETIKELKLSSKLQDLIKILENVLNEKWTTKNVNMSAIIKILLKVNSNTGLDCLAEVLKLIGAAHRQPSQPSSS